MKYLLLLFIAMSSFRAFGQYSLNGQVTDSTTSAPLDYIEIILKSPDNEWSNLSDEQGKYIFENLAPGMYQLIVNYNFEQVYNQSIEIESDLEKSQNKDQRNTIERSRRATESFSKEIRPFYL